MSIRLLRSGIFLATRQRLLGPTEQLWRVTWAGPPTSVAAHGGTRLASTRKTAKVGVDESDKESEAKKKVKGRKKKEDETGKEEKQTKDKKETQKKTGKKGKEGKAGQKEKTDKGEEKGKKEKKEKKDKKAKTPSKPKSPSSPSTKLSTSARGTAFELSTLALLQQLFKPALPSSSSTSSASAHGQDGTPKRGEAKMGMNLIRTGGAGDGGVDLAGWWTLPSASAALSSSSSSDSASQSPSSAHQSQTQDPSHLLIRLAVQCKSEAKKLGPVHVRELEGTLFRLSSRQQGQAKDVRGLIEALESAPFDEEGQSGTQSEVESEMESEAETQTEVGSQTETETETEVDLELDDSSKPDPKSPTPSPSPPPQLFNNVSIPVVGILASSSGFSTACSLSAMASPFPLILLHHPSNPASPLGIPTTLTKSAKEEAKISGPNTPEPSLEVKELPRALLWNTALERGLLKGRGELRWIRRLKSPTDGGTEGETSSLWPTFVWDGVESE